MQTVTAGGRPSNTLTALLRSLEAAGPVRRDKKAPALELGRHLSGLAVLSRDMEAILGMAERIFLRDLEASGISRTNVLNVLGLLSDRIIGKMESIHERLATLKGLRREGRSARCALAARILPEAASVCSSPPNISPATQETGLIQERLRARGTFGLPEKKRSCFAETKIKAFGDNGITAFGPSAMRFKAFDDAHTEDTGRKVIWA
jgi:hypothetical protein